MKNKFNFVISMGVRWCLGPNPKTLDDASVEVIKQLFLDQTGERYARESVRTLPIPEWNGNLILLDDNNMIRGLMWANTVSYTHLTLPTT